jgi:urease accessory protein
MNLDSKYRQMFQKIILLTIFFCLPSIMFAHGSHGSGMMAGFTHPILGLDHNVAILGTGILSYLLDPKKWYFYLLAFLSAMILGGFLGIDNVATLIVEKIIAFSVFSIGLIIAFRLKLNFSLVIIILGIFGFVHGYARGAEMPETNTALKYISGYSLGTVLLGIIGMLISKFIQSKNNLQPHIPILGGIITGCGLMILLS